MDVVGNTTGTPVVTSTSIDQGALLALGVNILRSPFFDGLTRIRVGIGKGNQPATIFSTVLIDDTVHPDHLPHWDGLLLMLPGDLVIAELVAYETLTIRVAIRTIAAPIPLVSLEP